MSRYHSKTTFEEFGLWRIVESCGCMTVEEMNFTFLESFEFCPFCGRKLVVE